LGIKSLGWAWDKLGIGKTSDKDAIHAAYAAKRAELDAQAMRISAFAELTEAREKALFLASALQREEERSPETSPETSPEVGDLAEVDEAAGAELCKEIVAGEAMPIDASMHPHRAPAEPENRGPWERGGGYRPAFDTIDEPSPRAEQVGPGFALDPHEEWSHAGAYVPDADQTVDPSRLVPPTDPTGEASQTDLRIRRAVRGVFERYPIKTSWIVYGILAVIFLRSCS